jgi:hypothetical protein
MRYDLVRYSSYIRGFTDLILEVKPTDFESIEEYLAFVQDAASYIDANLELQWELFLRLFDLIPPEYEEVMRD